MGNGFQFFDIILFALIAAFLVLRLRNTLGRRDGHEGDYQDPLADQKPDPSDADFKADDSDNVIPLPNQKPNADPWAPESDEENEPVGVLGRGLAAVASADSSFTPDSFMNGAAGAFEMILNAFASGDVKTLRPLLSDEVYHNFDVAVRSREEAGEILEETLVGIKNVEIVEAELDGRNANVTVKFVTEQVSALRSAAGDVIDGSPTEVIVVTDFWTFSRDTRSRDPNWTLTATRSLD